MVQIFFYSFFVYVYKLHKYDLNVIHGLNPSIHRRFQAYLILNSRICAPGYQDHVKRGITRNLSRNTGIFKTNYWFLYYFMWYCYDSIRHF